MEMTTAEIKIINLTKKYGDKTVFENFNLTLEKNRITVILGESGSGKTTLVNVLCGFTDYDGTVRGADEKFSVVFQKDCLIPNLTVMGNLRLVNPAVVNDDLKKVGLEGCGNMYIKELSAGMARRVAVLRALLYDAPALFADEPFVNIDLANKFAIIKEIRNAQTVKPKTIVCVTHDVKEAVMLADRVIVLKNGAIIFDDVNRGDETEKTLYGILSKKSD